MHKFFHFISICLFAVLTVGIVIYFLLAPYNDRVLFLGQTLFFAEVVDTPSAYQTGLSHRKNLCPHCAMVFAFDQPQKYTFWMKEMYFDIDIIWLRDGHIVHMVKNASHATPYKTYTPPESADRVIELPAGSIEKYHIF